MQCPLRLFLEVRTDVEPEPFSRGDLARFEMGHRVGALACERFGGGVVIEADHLHHDRAVAKTREAMGAGAPAIYEAAFVHDRTKVRIDILRRATYPQGSLEGSAGTADSNTWDLIEVKSTGGYEARKHLFDAAVQLYVARGAGVKVRHVYLMHLDKSYIWPGGPYDLERLFTLVDITDEAEELQPEIPMHIDRLMRVLQAEELPQVGDEVSCTSPHACRYTAFCAEGAPPHPIRELPYCGPRNRIYKELKARGLDTLLDIDERTASEVFARTDQLHTWRATVVERGLVVLPELGEWLDSLEHPVYFLDFETINPALPIYPGTHPYTVIPVQWSLHVMHADGRLEHQEYLATGTEDPRRELIDALLDALGDTGAILEYHGNGGYESRILRELGELYPDLRPRIEGVLARMQDLGTAIRQWVFHPEFRGRWSVKQVQPVLAPGLAGYEGMAVADGDAASVELVELLTEQVPPEAVEQLRTDLLAYCKMDTEAMVEMWRALSQAVGD